MYKKIIVSVFVFLSSYIQADIIPIDQIEDIRPYIDQNALVLFDIDDTLITNPYSLGSSPWRSWAKSKISHYDADFVVYDALTLYIAKKAHYKAVESSTVGLISDLQQSGIAVFAFTARGRSQWYTTDIKGVDQFTHKQLNHVGIDFKQTVIPVELQHLESTYFYKGIIFAQHIKKGDLLKHLLKDLNYHPSCIVFVDDKLDQVQSVEAVVKEAKIPFFGFWYRRAESDGANFSPMVANVQLENLLLKNKIVKDKEAKKIAETRSEKDPIEYLNWILDQCDITRLAPTFFEEEVSLIQTN